MCTEVCLEPNSYEFNWDLLGNRGHLIRYVPSTTMVITLLFDLGMGALMEKAEVGGAPSLGHSH